MHSILLLGAGKIGRMIARFLAHSGDYDVLVADDDRQRSTGSASKPKSPSSGSTRPIRSRWPRALAGRDAVVSALSFNHNPLVARGCARARAPATST